MVVVVVVFVVVVVVVVDVVGASVEVGGRLVFPGDLVENVYRGFRVN